jgi:hypothetical protein
MSPLIISAQNNEVENAQGDSIQRIEVKISADKLTALKNSNTNLDNRLKVAIKTISDLQMKIRRDSTAIKKSNAHISSLRADSLSTHAALRTMQEQYLKSEKALINMASNFIYIPYEAYSIDSVAIRSYESVTDKSLREEYLIRYTLLKNYKHDIIAFVAFLKEQQLELGRNPFRNDANDVVSLLHQQPFYISYQRYEDWSSTFLGGKIQFVENQLKSFKKSTKLNFGDIIDILEKCLKTE